MPSLETLPAELHFEILAVLSTPSSPPQFRRIACLALTSRTLYSVTYAHCSALFSRILADNPVLSAHNLPPIATVIRDLSGCCLLCGTRDCFTYQVFYPGLRRCKPCSENRFPTLTLTNALKIYRLTRHRSALESELKCERMNGPWGKMSIYLTADVEAFAERIHGMPIADFFALKEERVTKLSAARDALRAAKEKALDECLELNNVHDVPSERRESLMGIVELLTVTGGTHTMSTPSAVQKAVREEILRRRMREGGYEEIWRGLLDSGEYVLSPYPYDPTSETARDPYPKQWREPKLALVGSGVRDGEQICRFPTREFLGRMFFREFGDEGAEKGQLQQRMCDEPQEEKISLWCQQNFRDDTGRWEGRANAEAEEVEIGRDAFCAGKWVWQDRLLKWVPWSWNLYPVLVLEPSWIHPALNAKRTEKYKQKEERLRRLRNEKLKEEWEKLRSRYHNVVDVIADYHDVSLDLKKTLMAGLGMEVEGSP